MSTSDIIATVIFGIITLVAFSMLIGISYGAYGFWGEKIGFWRSKTRQQTINRMGTVNLKSFGVILVWVVFLVIWLAVVGL